MYGITSAAQNTYTNKTDGYGNGATEALKEDWGALIADGWRTLSKDEWDYILNTRTVNGGTGNGHSYTLGQKVNDQLGLVIYPDNYTGAVYAGSDWATFEAAGCVFLPAAGWRNGTALNAVGTTGFYWSSTTENTTGSFRLNFTNKGLNLGSNGRGFGFAVRLVISSEGTDNSGAYLINGKNDWEAFCTAVNNGNAFSGETVKLAGDVSGATTTVGTDETNSFQGIFDGHGHTLNVNVTDAPLRYIKNATFRNLVVTGSITNSANHVAGLSRATFGNITIENCNVAASISGAKYMGGYIGHSLQANITLRGCVFSGTLSPTGSNCTGGFVGWGGNGAHTFIIANCIFDGKVTGSATSKFHPVGCYSNPAQQTRTITNTYYTLAAQNMDEDTDNNSFVKGLTSNKGKLARSITAGDDVTALDISGAGTEYSVSGITAYTTGIKYNDAYYAGNGDVVGLTLCHADKTGYSLSQYTTATKVGFSQGNLQATYNGSAWTWAFAENQSDYIGSTSGNGNVTTISPFISTNATVDLFGWVGESSTWTDVNMYGVTSAAQGSYANQTDGYGNVADESLKRDWGTLIGGGWHTLSIDEWKYLLNTRTVNGGTGNGHSYTLGQKVNDQLGLVIYPDNYTGAVYAGSDWATFEAAGCVFLPAAGWRNGTALNAVGTTGFYWSSTTQNAESSYRLNFTSNAINQNSNGRAFGFAVRLVNGTPADGQLAGRFTVSSTSGTLSAQTETLATLTMIDADQTISAAWTKNELTLSEAADNATAISEANGKVYAVTLTRTLQQGGWNTFCVPFDLATPMGWTVKTLTASSFNSSTGEMTLTFADAASIEAGKPYLVKVTSTVANPTFEGVTISNSTTTTETASADFVPVMNPTSLTGGDKTVLFVTGGNKLTYPTADGNINGLRAYFHLKGDAVAEARAFRMSFDDNATGIVTVLTDEPTTATGIYTLDGRRLQGQSAGKGVYIVNGKKTIIK